METCGQGQGEGKRRDDKISTLKPVAVLWGRTVCVTLEHVGHTSLDLNWP